jgi:hypothetical protein
VEHLLTGPLAKLKKMNGFDIYIDYFSEGMNKLKTRFLSRPASGRIIPAPAENQQMIQRTTHNILQEGAGSQDPVQEILNKIRSFPRQTSPQVGTPLSQSKTGMGWIRVQRRKLSFLDRVDEMGLPKLRIFVNDRRIAELGGGDEKMLQIEPGSHLVQVGFGFAKSVQTQIQVQPGETALFECGYDNGNPYLKFVRKFGF